MSRASTSADSSIAKHSSMISAARMLGLAMLLSAFAAFAQSVDSTDQTTPPAGRLSFRAYTTEQGLPGLVVIALLQDRTGFIWAGTNAGLFRYDGSRFTPFGLQEGLPSTEILALHQDPKGMLWVGTRKGLVAWNGQSFDLITPEQGLPAIAIKGLASASGTLWVGTEQGVFIQTANGRFRQADQWSGGAVTSIWAGTKSNTLWVASSNAGTTLVQARTGNGWRSIDIPPGMDKASIDAMAEDGRGRLWARAPRSLWVLDPGALRFKQVIAPMPLVSDRGRLQAGHKGDIWITTTDSLVHLDGDTWTHLTTENGGLATHWSFSILVDRESSLWVGATGLFRLLGHGAWRAHTRAQGLPSDVIWTILRDREQQLWVGTDNGLVRATAQGWELIPGTKGRAIRTVVLKGVDGVLYMAGTPDTDVLRYDPKRQRLQHIELSRDLTSSVIYRLMLDSSGYLWAATDGAGVFRANTAAPTMHFERVSLPGGTPTESVIDVHQDAAGRIWFSGEHGLAMLENGTWRRFTSKDGLKADHVAITRSTKNGDLFIAYNDPLGVTRASYEGGSLKILQQLDTSTGLADNKVFLFGEDAKSRIWIGTSRGMDLVMPEGIEHFGVAEGLVHEDTNNMAFLAEPNGDVWVGTSGGLAHFEDNAYPGIAAPPSTSFLSLELGGTRYREAKPQVPYNANTFEAQFSSLNFVKEASIQQQVRLQGLESQWRTNTTHEARYPALPYGDYRFEVRSRVKQGPWGPVAAFEFEVLPPWWHTWWFRTLLVLAFIGLSMLVLRWRLHMLHKKNRLLEQQVATRTKELEVANLALADSNLALKNQSLTDPLTALRNRRFLSECIPDDVAQANRLNREARGAGKNRMALNIDLLFIMVDLDHFKHVNDEYGHPAGDKVLQQMSVILKEATRDTDTVVRWGGEEFLIVGRHVCRNDFTTLAERIRSNVAGWAFDIGDGKTIELTCSLGFALYPFVPKLPTALGWEAVVALADQCLYIAKHNGRNAWVGICPLEGSDDDLAAITNPVNLPERIADGTLIVHTSLPAGAIKNWARADSD